MRASRIDTLFGTDLFHYEVVALRDIGSLLFTLNLFKREEEGADSDSPKTGNEESSSLSTNRSCRGRDGDG